MNILPRGFAFLALGMIITSAAFAGILTSKHNLAASGTGSIRAVSERDVCIFCHIPHASPSIPLWNRDTSANTYIPYSSSTVVSSPGQPNGASVLCLSCHDGTIAIGKLANRPAPVAMMGMTTTMPTGPSNLGTDLSDDHPISFTYSTTVANQNPDLIQPSLLTGNRVELDDLDRVQCTSCHNPHMDTNAYFLEISTRNGALCTFCHANFTYWQTSSHATSPTTLPASSNQWQTVSENACGNCHVTHGGEGSQWLLKYSAEEDNCLVCHDGTVATSDIANVINNQLSRHPVDLLAGEHTPNEPNVITSRHVECTDCHNPHAAASNLIQPLGVLTGVRGVTIAGLDTASVNYEYELCFRCHGDGFGKPAPRTVRQIEQQNVRAEFSPVNPSFHPVAGLGKNQNVPSLIVPYDINSIIKCSDCHDSNNSSAVGGTGPRGPHGSVYEPILSMRYETLDNTIESPSTYALCYRCHDRTSILADESFKAHRLHIVDNNTSCNTCHDPHGVSNTQGTVINNSSLINFDVSIVTPNSVGDLRYESTGLFSGSCYLTCHGSDHAPQSY